MENFLDIMPKPNTFNLSKADVNAFISFNIGRTDYFWEYCNGIPFCQKREFTGEDFNNHLLGAKVFGFSNFIDNKNVRHGDIDFDAHRDEEDTEEMYQAKEKVAQGDAVKVYEYLRSFGLPVILNSSGSSGRHVRWYVGGAPATNVRMYLKYVLYKLLGDPNKHEVFPKQDELVEDRPFGNQIKGMLCVHPKHKLRANVIAGNRILDMAQSLKVMKLALENAGTVPKFSREDYNTIQALDQSHGYIEKYNTKEYLETQNVPDICPFFEEVASKYALPSKDKYSRHGCLDCNMAAYGITHPETRIAYAEAQGRSSHTAFDNWPKYWTDGKPLFSCGQIIAYLRNHVKFGNKNAKLGLAKCLSCPKFKGFMEEQQVENLGPVRGWALSVSITDLAKKHKLEYCPVCGHDFSFQESHGLYFCKYCGKGGGLKKFAELIIKKTKEETI